MSEEIPESSQATATQTAPPTTLTVTEPERPSEVTLKRSHIVLFCSIGLIVTFFLPWVQILWATPSGFELSKGNDFNICLWIMPAFACIATISGLTGLGDRPASILAGIVPFCILIFGLIKLGQDLFKVIAFGGWIALGLSFVLIITAAKK